MGRFRALHNLTRGDDSVDNRRRGGRILTDPIRCSAGEVLDLSCTGARFVARTRWRVGEMREMKFALSGGDNAVAVRARCAWEKRKGLFGQVVGVKFEGLTDVQTLELTRLATRAAKRAWGSGPSSEVDWDRLERQARIKGSSQEAA